MDAEAAHHAQIEKLEDQLRSAAEVKVCKLFTGFYVLTVTSRQWKKLAILLLSFQKVKCISLIYAKTSDQNCMYVVKKYWHC